MCRFDLILVIPSPVLLPTICLYSLHSHCFLNICTFCESFVVPLCSIISLPFFAIWTRAVELEGFSTWGVGVVENFNDSDSGQTFCSPIVTVCATNVTLGNLSSLTLQQEMIIAIPAGGSTLTCIPSLKGHSRSAASLGSSRNLHFVNATIRGLYNWNFHLLILVGTIVAPWRWLRNSEWEFSWELVHCYVTHVTEQW